MADAEIRVELSALEREERTVSDRRRRLQDRIDFLRGNGASTDELEQVLADERALSERRRELHGRIDALRLQGGLSPGPPPRAPRIGP